MAKKTKIEKTPRESLPANFVRACESITNKRPRIVIDHILKHGAITTEELKEIYGYDHPPRAAGDVRDEGVPLKTNMISSPRTGRKIAAYTFGSVEALREGRLGGRTSFSKKFKSLLVEKYGSRDAITKREMNALYLQIDHRIPYRVEPDAKEDIDPNDYMLLSASSNRSKSWACESCENFLNIQKREICENCFWAFPERYEHVAMLPIRRLEIEWEGKQIDQFEKLMAAANATGITISDLIKKKIGSL